MKTDGTGDGPGHAPLAVAVSARALFDLEESHRVFERDGVESYLAHIRASEEAPLQPGPAFPLIRALLGLNRLAPKGKPAVEVIAASSISPDGGLRILNSIAHHGLEVRRAAFTGGSPVVPYLAALGADLLLSRSDTDVQEAVDRGMAAAKMYSFPEGRELDDGGQIRIAFDGDAVLFSDESERIYKAEGLTAFMENERRRAREPMAEGPFAKFLRTVHRVQAAVGGGTRPFRIALVTARGGDAQERALRTLRAWDIEVDEAYFLNGSKKDRILECFAPHIFFDDQDLHLGPASLLVPSARVPYVGG